MGKQITLLGQIADEVYTGIYKLREPVTTELWKASENLSRNGFYCMIVSVELEENEIDFDSIHRVEYLLDLDLDTSVYWKYFRQNIDPREEYSILAMADTRGERLFNIW